MSLRILFVENHRAFADVVTATFLASDTVEVASSIAQALALDVSRFDVVLVDYDLDDGKGDTLVRELRRENPTIPIIAVSSHAQGNAALCAAGANATCAKTSFRKIRETIQAFISGGA